MTSTVTVLKARFPQSTIVICGDPDPAGRKAAKAAQNAQDVLAVFPLEEGQDFNDLCKLSGKEPVAELVNAAFQEKKPLRKFAELVVASSIEPEAVEWIWPSWLARKKLHLVAGAPGQGKTTLALDLIARVSRGGAMPDGFSCNAAEVLMWSGEDDPADTLVPRLIAAGADLERIKFVTASFDDEGNPQAFNPATDIPMLRAQIGPTKPGLLVVDPLVSAISGDSHKGNDVRRGLQPLVDFAEQHHCAVLGITHFAKGSAGRSPVDRPLGSIAFAAAARVVLAVARFPDDDADHPGSCLLTVAKSNIGENRAGWVFDIDQTQVRDIGTANTVRWVKAIDGDAASLLRRAELRTSEEGDAVTEATDFLRDELANGPQAVSDIRKRAKQCGISDRTLRRSKKKLGVKLVRKGFGKGGEWEMPQSGTNGHFVHSGHSGQGKNAGQNGQNGQNDVLPADDGIFI